MQTGKVILYFRGCEPFQQIELNFNDGVLQNVLRGIMNTEVRIDLSQQPNESETILIPFRILVEMLVRRGLVPYTSGDNDTHGY